MNSFFLVTPEFFLNYLNILDVKKVSLLSEDEIFLFFNISSKSELLSFINLISCIFYFLIKKEFDEQY